VDLSRYQGHFLLDVTAEVDLFCLSLKETGRQMSLPLGQLSHGRWTS
jgi:hypothetical protein